MSDMERYLHRIGAWMQGGYISVHYVIKRTNMKPIFPGYACSNINQTIQQARYWAYERQTDVYLAMGAQKEHGGFREKGPKLPKAIRRTHNIVACKSLYMDVDVDTNPKKDAYRTIDEMDTALEKFYNDTGIPQSPFIIASGRGGKHLYWPFKELIHPADFAPLAQSLINAAKSTGLKFDTQCTKDICRLLRIPGTFNFKSNKKFPVSITYDIDDEYDVNTVQNWLMPWWTNVKAPVTINSGGDDGEDWSDTDSLGAGIDDYTPADINLIRKECPFIDETLTTGGKGQSNVLWFYALGIAASTTDPQGNAHLLSNGYEAYEPTEVNEKLKEIQQTRKLDPAKGPAKCNTIKNEAPQCATCKHRDSNATPVSFGFNGTHPTINSSIQRTNDQDLPANYFRGQRDQHIYYLNGAEDDGIEGPQEVKVFPYQIKPYSGYIEKGNGYDGYRIAFVTDEAGISKDVLLNVEQISDKFAMGKALAKQGLPTLSGEPCRRFLMSFYSKLVEARQNIIDIPPVGWYTRDGETGFAFGGEFITPTTSMRCHSLPPEAANYGIMGEVQPWTDLAKVVIDNKRPDLSTLVASAFAAPLVIASGQQGFTLGCWSASSGIAKTTAITLAQAVWGSPLGINGLSDTAASIFAKAATLHNLPMYIDEIKTVSQIANFLSVIFQVTSGREKARANRDGSMRVTKGWELPIVYASNSSMVEAATEHHKGSPAMLYRMFEFRGLPNQPTDHSPSDIARMSKDLYSNYGGVGKLYAEYLGRNYNNVVKLVKYTQNDLEKQLNINQDERFWIAVIGTILSGAYIAKKLKIANFDIAAMERFLINEFNQMRKGKETSSVDYGYTATVVHELSQFLGPLRGRQTVVTDMLWMQPGRPPRGVIKVLNDGPHLQQNYIRVQISKLPQLFLRFADAELADYCTKRGIPKATLTEAMKTKLTGRIGPGRIGSGTPYSNLTELVWTFAVTGTPLEQEVEWTTQYFS